MSSPTRNNENAPFLSSSWTGWVYAWTLAGSAGMCLALLLWRPTTIIGIGVVPSLAAGVLFWFYQSQTGSSGRATADEGHERRSAGRDVSRRGLLACTAKVVLCTATLAVSFCALAVVSVPVALLLVVVVGFTTPPLVERVSRAGKMTLVTPAPFANLGSGGNEVDSGAPRLEDAAGVPPFPSVPPVPLDRLTNRELCLAWRRSFLALLEARTPTQRERVVALRQGYLDEMESRDPAALEAWLASAPRVVPTVSSSVTKAVAPAPMVTAVRRRHRRGQRAATSACCV